MQFFNVLCVQVISISEGSKTEKWIGEGGKPKLPTVVDSSKHHQVAILTTFWETTLPICNR